MSEVVFMRRQLGALRPIDAFGMEALGRIPYGQEVKVEITRPRNLLRHRKYFALLNAVFPHQTLYPTLDSLRSAMAAALGHCDTINLPDGREIIVPKSISFANMDQAAFEQFYERAVELILTRILPGVGREDLNREVADILAGRASLSTARAGSSPNKRLPEAVG